MNFKPLFNTICILNNNHLTQRFLHTTTMTTWHNLFDRNSFVWNRIYNMQLKPLLGLSYILRVCVLSSVCYVMHLWQVSFLLNFYTRVAYFLPYYMSEIEQRDRMQVPINCFRILHFMLPISVIHLNYFN